MKQRKRIVIYECGCVHIIKDPKNTKPSDHCEIHTAAEVMTDIYVNYDAYSNPVEIEQSVNACCVCPDCGQPHDYRAGESGGPATEKNQNEHSKI